MDHILKDNFPDRWITAEFPPAGGNNSALIGQWIKNNPKAVAFSTHTGSGPVPKIDGVKIVSVLFLRDPIARIQSAYRFEAKQKAEKFGPVLARHTDLNGYVRTRLALPNDRQCRNFQTKRLSTIVPGPESELSRAQAAMAKLSLVGRVEAFDASMARLEMLLKPDFPEFSFQPTHANRTGKTNALDCELHKILIDHNQDDIALLKIV